MAAIVFDLDGTLIDSAPDICGIANALLDRVGRAPITLAETRDFIGNGAGVFVARLRAARDLPDADHDRLLAEFIRRYDDAVHLTRPYPGVEEALSALLRAGHVLGICTNKPIRPTRVVLRHLGFERFFETVLGGDSLPVHKPDPAPLCAVFEALPQAPEIYVGDSEVDAETARRAGVPFLLFTEGYRKCPVDQMPHAAAFSDFAALPGLVARQVSVDV
ncbi:phosphoglycolate phosphatase [Anianabacter salinae]|uniref:phosphoglycolate phosphatase n=1 Tax=Anianabacter salinae TaxID=2851023 RepID=UPI00225E2265|nr:phosphoglycolate phosphatase [Anianabacter salinae]MBV0912069.1 phosphoglycolate phosphatase [Anianabacter salinae]